MTKGPVELTKSEIRLVPSGGMDEWVEMMATGTENESGLWLLHGKPPIEQAPSPDPAPPLNLPTSPSSFLHRHGKRMVIGGMAIGGMALAAAFLAGVATSLIMHRAPPAPPAPTASVAIQNQTPHVTEIPSPVVTQTEQMQTWLSQSQSKLPLPAISSAVPPPHHIPAQRLSKPIGVEYHHNHLSFAARRTEAQPAPATNNCPPSVCFPWVANR